MHFDGSVEMGYSSRLRDNERFVSGSASHNEARKTQPVSVLRRPCANTLEYTVSRFESFTSPYVPKYPTHQLTCDSAVMRYSEYN